MRLNNVKIFSEADFFIIAEAHVNPMHQAIQVYLMELYATASSKVFFENSNKGTQYHCIQYFVHNRVQIGPLSSKLDQVTCDGWESKAAHDKVMERVDMCKAYKENPYKAPAEAVSTCHPSILDHLLTEERNREAIKLFREDGYGKIFLLMGLKHVVPDYTYRSDASEKRDRGHDAKTLSVAPSFFPLKNGPRYPLHAAASKVKSAVLVVHMP